jgi:hypothetical protein
MASKDEEGVDGDEGGFEEETPAEEPAAEETPTEET